MAQRLRISMINVWPVENSNKGNNIEIITPLHSENSIADGVQVSSKRIPTDQSVINEGAFTKNLSSQEKLHDKKHSMVKNSLMPPAQKRQFPLLVQSLSRTGSNRASMREILSSKQILTDGNEAPSFAPKRGPMGASRLHSENKMKNTILYQQEKCTTLAHGHEDEKHVLPQFYADFLENENVNLNILNNRLKLRGMTVNSYKEFLAGMSLRKKTQVYKLWQADEAGKDATQANVHQEHKNIWRNPNANIFENGPFRKDKIDKDGAYIPLKEFSEHCFTQNGLMQILGDEVLNKNKGLSQRILLEQKKNDSKKKECTHTLGVTENLNYEMYLKNSVESVVANRHPLTIIGETPVKKSPEKPTGMAFLSS